MTNRLPLRHVSLGLYPPRQAQPQYGRVIEIQLPSILPPAEHTPTPPLFIYGSRYKILPHEGDKIGDAVLSLSPAFKEDGGRQMQKMGSRVAPDEWPRTTKIEFNELSGPFMPDLFQRLESFLQTQVLSQGDLFDLTADEAKSRIYGRKFDFEALAHPVTGRITLYFPGETETNDSESETLG